jgi:hypothetical protein
LFPSLDTRTMCRLLPLGKPIQDFALLGRHDEPFLRLLSTTGQIGDHAPTVLHRRSFFVHPALPFQHSLDWHPLFHAGTKCSGISLHSTNEGFTPAFHAHEILRSLRQFHHENFLSPLL